MITTQRPVGDVLREWRLRRRMSQLDLACEADISTRHLSFLETGRSQPSRDMVLHLAERLDLPLRDRNAMLVAAGFAPIYSERRLDDPALNAARAAIDLVLAGHEPSPAIAIDRHWTLIASNNAARALMSSAAPALLTPPINVLRLSLHPDGLAPRILNTGEWCGHVLARLRRQIDMNADAVLMELLRELETYPAASASRDESMPPGFVVPLRMSVDDEALSFVSTTTVFGTPMDVTLAELAIESFFPADAATAAALRRRAMT
jgi:transcriptional regulator with XRE-family HTH domain